MEVRGLENQQADIIQTFGADLEYNTTLARGVKDAACVTFESINSWFRQFVGYDVCP